MNGVNAVILERMQSKVALIPELAGHLIAGGGKRMRPMLTLACASLLGYPGTRHHKLAAAVEFIHTATLLHDDVVDGSGHAPRQAHRQPHLGQSGERAGRRFPVQPRLRADGRGRQPQGAARSSATPRRSSPRARSTSSPRSAGSRPSEEHYLDIISAKTAALFAAACRVAPVVAEAARTRKQALDAYGRNLGIAFQLIDDAIDYASDAATMGKGVGDDFRDGKMTLPVILAYARGSEADRTFWRAAMAGERVSRRGSRPRDSTLLRSTDALADTIERARHYGRRAIDALGIFPASKAKAALIEAAEFAVARAY